MSDIIKPNDLVDEATITRLEKLYKTIIDVKGGLEASLVSVRDYLAMWKAGDSKSILELNKAINESVKLQAELTKVGKEQLKAQQELEKLNALSEKTTREKNKAEAAAFDLKVKNNKEAERQNAIALKTEKAQKKAIADTQNINKQVRDLTKQLATMNRDEDPAGYDRIAKQAGVLKDQINDAKDAVAVFSKESKAATAKTLFGQIAGDIKDLDFAGAADKAKQFAGIVKSITFAEVIGGIKNFGSALLDIGKALLLNPFTLILAAVTALAVGVYYLTKSWNDNAEALKLMTERTTAFQKRMEALSESIRSNQQKDAVVLGKLTQKQADLNDVTNEYNKSRTENNKLREQDIKALQREYEIKSSLVDAQTGLAKFETKQNLNTGQTFKLNVQNTLNYNKKIKDINAQTDAENTQLIRDRFAKEKLIVDTDRKNSEVKLGIDKNTSTKRIETVKKTAKIVIEEEKRFDDELLKLSQEYGDRQIQSDIEEAEKRAAVQGRLAQRLAERREEEEKIAKQEKEMRDRALKAIEDGLKRASDLRKEAINKELKDREESIETQQRLAERGLENTLEFEKGAQAQAELRQEQQKRRELRRQKGLTYLKLVAAYADKGDTAATRKALVDIALSDAIAGSFIDGTEKVEDDLKGSKVHNGVDGYHIAVDGRERILNPEQNAMIGNMSNDELAAIGKAYNDGTLLPHYATDHSTSGFAANVANSILVQQLAQMNKKFDQMIQVTKNKRESSSHIDNAGNVITTDIENGFKTVTKKLRRKPRI